MSNTTTHRACRIRKTFEVRIDPANAHLYQPGVADRAAA